ncbi:MAG: hypothetical protein ACOCXE_03655 [Spirochaetota bacterium]
MSDDVIRVVNRSNQRGGRMLSLVDLVEAETFTLPMAAWVTERIEGGASFLVGANPGGAGKTAVMGALLVMLPPGERVYITRPGDPSWRSAGSGDCLVAYEISPASFEAYIWGTELRTFVSRGLTGARLVANLHADTLEEAREQFVEDNGVDAEHFEVFDLFVPITMAGGLGRRARVVQQVDYTRDGAGWTQVGREPELSPRGAEIARFLEDCNAAGRRRVEEVRAAWLEFLRR